MDIRTSQSRWWHIYIAHLAKIHSIYFIQEKKQTFIFKALQPVTVCTVGFKMWSKWFGGLTRPSLIQLSCRLAATGHPEGWVTGSNWRYAKMNRQGESPGLLPLQPGNHSSLHVDAVYWVTSILAACLLEHGGGGGSCISMMVWGCEHTVAPGVDACDVQSFKTTEPSSRI